MIYYIRQSSSVIFSMHGTHTHTHTHIYIYIYTERARERNCTTVLHVMALAKHLSFTLLFLI